MQTVISLAHNSAPPPQYFFAAALPSPGSAFVFRFAFASAPLQLRRMLRGVFMVFVLVGLLGCAKSVDLPERVVRAATSEELAAFRAELGRAFAAERMEPFDTALNELRLDAMNRNLAPASARERDMLAVVNGQTVRQTEVLGWQARLARIRREILLFTTTLVQDLKSKQESPGSVSQTVANRIQNVEDILTRLERDLAETEQQLAVWGAEKSP